MIETVEKIFKLYREHILGQRYIHKEIDNHINNDRIHLPVEFSTPESLTVNDGGTPVGDIDDITELLDGNEYHLPETTGVPGFDLLLNFVNISNIKGIAFRIYYEGSTSHQATFRLYNYETSTYDIFMQVSSSGGYSYRYIEIPDGSNYFDSAGNAIVQIYHDSSGNASHDLYVDYVALLS